jgi:transcriptional regulator
MYAPPQHRADHAAQLAFMRRYAFATLVSAGTGGVLQATHLPLALREAGGTLRLLGHQARANPQWRELAGAQVLAIFQGPHAYISPSLYQRQPSVPTWDYAAVHAYGRLRLLERAEDKLAGLRTLVADHDTPWLAELERLPPDFLALKLEGIVAFEIEVSRLEARWKLSQERTPVERGHIAAILQASGDSATAESGAMIAALDR